MIPIYLSMLTIEEDKDIFIILHDIYSQTMYKKAYSILKDATLAEDAVQESFIHILKNFDKVIKEKCPQTRKYFVNIVRNVSIDIYRKRKKEYTLSFDEFEETIIDDFANVEDLLEGKEIESYLFQLPKSYYTILSLKYDEGYSYKEIADILSITEENVKKRIYRARKKFKEILSEKEVVIQ